MNTRYDSETLDAVDAAELLARAQRIRARSRLLIQELGPDHPLVARALQKARSLEAQADRAEIHLR